VQLNLSSSKLSTLTVSVSNFQKDVERIVATAYAVALGWAYDFKTERGCLAWVNAGGCIWTEGYSELHHACHECVATYYDEGAVSSIDAIAAAGARMINGRVHYISLILGRNSCDD
jgi:hypothetical protein